jgi:multimeric flavodoxin WrbA
VQHLGDAAARFKTFLLRCSISAQGTIAKAKRSPNTNIFKEPLVLTAIAINCSLKGSASGSSSTDRMIGLLGSELGKRGVTLVDTIRIADFDVKPGVSSDEGPGDDWPRLRARILAADILIFGTPIWLGQASSIAQRVTERMDAFLSETDEQERMPSYGKVAMLAVGGTEDGAHHVGAPLYQELNDTGWTLPAGAVCYWVGEALGKIDFQDLDEVPEKIAKTAAMAASNAAHLARLLQAATYPGIEAPDGATLRAA